MSARNMASSQAGSRRVVPTLPSLGWAVLALCQQKNTQTQTEKQTTMNTPHHRILSVETFELEGGCPVDFINLKSGQILAIEGGTLVLYRDLSDFEDRNNVNRPSLELNA